MVWSAAQMSLLFVDFRGLEAARLLSVFFSPQAAALLALAPSYNTQEGILSDEVTAKATR